MRSSSTDEVKEQLIMGFKNDIERNIDEFTENSSGWVSLKISKVTISIHDYVALPGGSSYIVTPKQIAVKKAVVNVQNRDNRCLLWSILAALREPKEHAKRVAKYKLYGMS